MIIVIVSLSIFCGIYFGSFYGKDFNCMQSVAHNILYNKYKLQYNITYVTCKQLSEASENWI